MQRMIQLLNPPSSPKSPTALRFGILGAARIGPNALFTPAKSHPDVVVTAVACRDQSRGATYARKYGIPQTYSGPNCYQELVDDPNIDAVYVALPNALHYEWSMRAIGSGKHVLIEKPVTDSAEEARKIFELAESTGVVALEAIHFSFHPATQRAKAIIDSGELGKVKSIVAKLALPSLLSSLAFMSDDIRFSYDLGGGSAMDLGVYAVAAIRFFTGSNELLELTRAEAIGVASDETRVDRSMRAFYAMPDSVSGETFVDFALPGWGPFGIIPHMPKVTTVIKLEGGEIEFFNYVLPSMYHSIKVKPRTGEGRTEKVYTHPDGTGEPWWSTYHYQLEAFVDKIRGRTPQYWTDPKTTISQIDCIEKVYKKAGMLPRITSSYVHESDVRNQ